MKKIVDNLAAKCAYLQASTKTLKPFKDKKRNCKRTHRRKSKLRNIQNVFAWQIRRKVRKRMRK